MGMLRKEDNDWVKKCMEYEVQGPRPKKTWREVEREDCQAREMNRVGDIDHCKWRKMIKDVWWSVWVWVGECFFLVPAYPGCPGQKAVKRLCVCVFVEFSRQLNSRNCFLGYENIWKHISVMFLSCLHAEICEKVYFTSIMAAILDFFKILPVTHVRKNGTLFFSHLDHILNQNPLLKQF